MTGQFTEGLISACERLPVTDKSRWMMTDAEKKAGVFDFRRRFRDFSANQLRTALHAIFRRFGFALNHPWTGFAYQIPHQGDQEHHAHQGAYSDEEIVILLCHFAYFFCSISFLRPCGAQPRPSAVRCRHPGSRCGRKARRSGRRGPCWWR